LNDLLLLGKFSRLDKLKNLVHPMILVIAIVFLENSLILPPTPVCNVLQAALLKVVQSLLALLALQEPLPTRLGVLSANHVLTTNTHQRKEVLAACNVFLPNKSIVTVRSVRQQTVLLANKWSMECAKPLFALLENNWSMGLAKTSLVLLGNLWIPHQEPVFRSFVLLVPICLVQPVPSVTQGRKSMHPKTVVQPVLQECIHPMDLPVLLALKDRLRTQTKQVVYLSVVNQDSSGMEQVVNRVLLTCILLVVQSLLALHALLDKFLTPQNRLVLQIVLLDNSGMDRNAQRAIQTLSPKEELH